MAAAACKRGLMIGFSARARWTVLKGNQAAAASSILFENSVVLHSSSLLASKSYYRKNDCRHNSQLVNKFNGKKAFLVDTLALVRRLEAQGMPSKQAEAITSAITEVLNDSLENVAQSFVSQGEIQKTSTEVDMPATWIDSDRLRLGWASVKWGIRLVRLRLPRIAEHHFAALLRETEKLKNDIDKMRSELRYEVDKVTAGQRLDLNLERGRTRDELAEQSAETSDLTNKLDREIHALKAQLEAAKYDVIKYCIGTLVSISAVGLAILRILM